MPPISHLSEVTFFSLAVCLSHQWRLSA